MSRERPRLCGECGSPLDGDQRYCLICGGRAGESSPLLDELQRRVARASRPAGARPSPREVARLSASAPPRVAGLRLPPAKVSALLVLVFLGFGVLLGGTAGAPVQSTLAASARRVKLVLPAPAATPTTATPSGEASAPAPEAATQAPESEVTPTPEVPAPAATTTTPAKAHAPTPAPAQGGASTPGASRQSGPGPSGAAPAPASKLPPIKHVFVIMLSDQPYASVFGPVSPAHYLTGTLERRGTLLARYDAVAHEELANEIALISGQGPTAQTAANCPTYADLLAAGAAPEEQLLGSGCVYPASTQTLPGQLTARHLGWRAYVEGTGEAGAGAPSCAHPAPGASDPSAAQAGSTGPYATFRNPFVYFHSILDSPACAAEDGGLGALKGDLTSPARTPSLSYIVPDRCHDANPAPCSAGSPAGLLPADGFLKQVVPEIMASKAYKQAGLLVITVDEAPSSGEYADSSSCCGQPSFPNLAAASAPTGLSPRGGGAVGALLLSPYLKGGVTSQEPYNHFSLLRTIEDLFALKPLGYAALSAVKPFEAAIFSSRKLG